MKSTQQTPSISPSNQSTYRRVLYAEAVYDEKEIEAVVTVLRHRRHTLMSGPAVAEMESRVAGLFGKPTGVMTNSGSSANALALAALELPAHSEVITPVCTFSTTVAPIVQQGHVPSFVDVGVDTFQIDPDAIEAMISEKTAAIMAPNLIGNLPDWQRVREVADRHGLKVIEDSADTLGSVLHGEPAGRFADVSTTSFYASHVVTCAGFGGMACFSDEKLAHRARLLRGWGRSSAVAGETEDVAVRFAAEVDGIPYDSKFLFDAIGYNYLPSEVGAAFGLVQLDRLSDYIDRRVAHYLALTKFFSEYQEWFVLPRQLAGSRTAWLAVPLIVRANAPFKRRELQEQFEMAGIQTRPVFAGNILRHRGFCGIERREAPGGYPRADDVMRGGILLGCHQGMKADDLTHIMQTFRVFADQVSRRQ